MLTTWFGHTRSGVVLDLPNVSPLVAIAVDRVEEFLVLPNRHCHVERKDVFLGKS